MPITILHKFGDRLHSKSSLTFIEHVEDHIYPSGKRRKKALFMCDCGGIKSIIIKNVKNGNTKSCGCRRVNRLKTHGFSDHYLFNTWNNMINRCADEKHEKYINYGARGIMVCDSWISSFEKFISDMGDRPSSKHSIDRIDNDGNYEPSNCRWATQLQQARNKRTSRLITFNGKTQCLADWADDIGINYKALHNRVNKLGWTDSRALTEALR